MYLNTDILLGLSMLYVHHHVFSIVEQWGFLLFFWSDEKTLNARKVIYAFDLSITCDILIQFIAIAAEISLQAPNAKH